MAAWVIYLIIAAFSTILFQCVIRYLQKGCFDEGDSIVAALGGFFWPFTYPAIVISFAIVMVSKVFDKISEYIYNIFK